ncbi:MAG: ATP-binding protein [Pseudomonadota bacterium]
MLGLSLRSYLPRSLFGRAALIVILPILFLQLVVAVVFIQRHFEGVTKQMTRSIAREIAVAMQIIRTSPSPDIAQVRLNNLAIPLDFPMFISQGEVEAGRHSRLWYDWSGRALTQELTTILGSQISVDLLSSSRLVGLQVQTEKGILRANIPRRRVTASNPHQLLVLMIGTAVLLGLIAILFLRNQVRPILRLADVAEAFGKGRSLPYRPQGAEEVRRAGGAFLSMRARLERQIEQRTLMLSGVSHDLRTPLTRMKLALAMLDDMPELADMVRDVDDMERMLDEFLAFARGDSLEEATQVNVLDLADDLVAKAKRAGHEITFHRDLASESNPTLTLRKSAVTRALDNLVANAARYGTRVRVTLKLRSMSCYFTVEDDGPGIPEDKREEVLRPFTRLDTARNQDKGGGVGLGLSIAADVARSHGGGLDLGKSLDLGGLSATLRLPR